MLLKESHKYLNFHFEDAKSSTSLKYLIDSERKLADVFFTRLQSFFETAPNLKCQYTAANGLHYSKEDIDFLIKKLKVYVLLLNRKSHVFNLKQIDRRLLDNINDLNFNKTLNLLHEDFEQNMDCLQVKYQKTANNSDNRYEYLHLSEVLNTINNTIHEAEGAFLNYHSLKNNQAYVGFCSTCLLDSNGWTGERYNLREEDYQEFALEQFFGQLCIGYDTTGKNLLHAYWTNDLKIVREHKVTPQTSFGTNVLLYFRSDNLTHKTVYDSFSHWYDRHNLKQDGYSKKISDESLGNITLGKLKYVDRTEVDLDRLNLQDKFSIIDLIKNKILKTYFPSVESSCQI